MFLRKSKSTRAKQAVAKQAVTEQVNDRTDDLMAALDAARDAISRASTAAARKRAELSAELTKEATRAADKLLPERAKQRRREAARKRRRRLLTGGAGLLGAGLLAGWLTSAKRGSEAGQGAWGNQAGEGWDRAAEPGQEPDSAEVTQLHQGNGASTNPARTPPTS
jgi:hypothetical protein